MNRREAMTTMIAACVGAPVVKASTAIPVCGVGFDLAAGTFAFAFLSPGEWESLSQVYVARPDDLLPIMRDAMKHVQFHSFSEE